MCKVAALVHFWHFIAAVPQYRVRLSCGASAILTGGGRLSSRAADPSGARFPVFSNEGHALRSDVTGGARFFYAPDLA